MGEGMNVFDRSVRLKNSEFHIVFRLIADGSFDNASPSFAIFRMCAVQPFVPAWHALLWIEAIDPIPFVGEVHGLSSREPPSPTGRVREPLSLLEIRLAMLQSLVESTQSGRRVIEDLAKLRQLIIPYHRHLV